MSKKICILGAGHVGSTIAYTLTVTGLVSEIVMIDIDKEKVKGEAMDIIQGTAFCSPISIYAGDYSDAVGSDLVIITSGMGRKPGQTRIDLAQKNVDVMKAIMPQLVKYAPDALYIVVSNPVDILTYVIAKTSGLPQGHVIGSGTILDSARLRALLAEHVSLSARSVHAYVLGEHGDTSVVPWSLTTIGGMQLNQYCEKICVNHGMCGKRELKGIEEDVRSAGGKIIASKGATYYAIAVAVKHICECVLGGTDSVLTVSSVIDGSYGIRDVALSLPSVIGDQGIRSVLTPPLLPEEEEQLHRSAEALKTVLKSLSI